MANPIIEERNDVVRRGDPEEAREFVVRHGGEEPPADTDWPAVFEAARKSIVGMPEFDETYGYGVLPDREMAVADDLIFPRSVLLRLLGKAGE